MKTILSGIAFVTLFGVAGVQAADQPPGWEEIRQLAGCHDVSYRFYEDGEHDHFNEKYGLGTRIRELITLVDDEQDKLTLQHASINEEGVAIPHWHEEWTYGPAGWTQAVYSRTPGNPDRALRYICTAPWSLNQWHCAAGRATKPFRDAGAPFGFQRSDYAWLDRTNTLLVTPEGWVHSENNKKMDESGKLVSYELGFITYRKLDEQQCRAPDAVTK